MTNANQELTHDQLEQTSGGWDRPYRGIAGFIALVHRMQNVPAVPQFHSLDVIRPWFK